MARLKSWQPSCSKLDWSKRTLS
ncbi:hypothetical protein RLOC_00011034 [Lonchura striata]|uniref:Uncharacterized protein n=1 Tax=Lonchura striata TaxID=40157 RepID=A0A218VDS2_9PASE|nr:hypothetical protein RLOC_00011034 [Lonchura striata domestica]